MIATTFKLLLIIEASVLNTSKIKINGSFQGFKSSENHEKKINVHD